MNTRRDAFQTMAKPDQQGNHCEEEPELQTFFKLSEGGQVVQAIGNIPWGGRYSELTDQLG
ncbi:MAG: hypothetical protein SH818_17665 [Saprospiraceae bacterium]|nr:hypothetical protein [Saprospiraceae bacterium]